MMQKQAPEPAPSWFCIGVMILPHSQIAQDQLFCNVEFDSDFSASR